MGGASSAPQSTGTASPSTGIAPPYITAGSSSKGTAPPSKWTAAFCSDSRRFSSNTYRKNHTVHILPDQINCLDREKLPSKFLHIQLRICSKIDSVSPGTVPSRETGYKFLKKVKCWSNLRKFRFIRKGAIARDFRPRVFFSCHESTPNAPRRHSLKFFQLGFKFAETFEKISGVWENAWIIRVTRHQWCLRRTILYK